MVEMIHSLCLSYQNRQQWQEDQIDACLREMKFSSVYDYYNLAAKLVRCQFPTFFYFGHSEEPLETEFKPVIFIANCVNGFCTHNIYRRNRNTSLTKHTHTNKFYRFFHCTSNTLNVFCYVAVIECRQLEEIKLCDYITQETLKSTIKVNQTGPSETKS